jgi:hypothetical protein
MPIYVFTCKEGHVFDRILKLKDYDTPQTCDCGLEAKRKIVPTMLNCDMQSWDYYESPVSGKPITSYKARKEDMARHGCVDYEPSMKKVQKKKIEKMDSDLDKRIDDTVDREWDKMPTHKRERLAKELVHGADIEIERR